MNVLIGKRKSQVFITAIIVLAIVLTLGGALLFHSRSSRDVAKLQVDSDKAYSLAKSGIGIAEHYIADHSNDPTLSATTYNLGAGNIILKIAFDQDTRTGNITSKGEMGKSTRILTKTFGLAPAASSCETTWAKNYPGSSDNFKSLDQTSDGGYILGGRATSLETYYNDFFIIKTDCSGKVEWTKSYEGQGSDYNYYFGAFQQTDDGGHILGGRFDSPSGYGALVIKTDKDGNVQNPQPPETITWARKYISTPPTTENWGFFALEQTSGAGYEGYIFGGALNWGIEDGYAGCLAIKTNTDGSVAWAKKFTSNFLVDPLYNTGFDVIRSAHQTRDTSGNVDGYILGGETAYSAQYDFLVIKTDTQGRIGADANPSGSAWRKRYDHKPGSFSNINRLRCLQKTSDGGYILGGETAPSASTIFSFLVIKIFSNGTVDWAKTYACSNPGSASDSLYFLQQTTDGGYILGGTTVTTGGLTTWNFLAIKTDSQGNVGGAFSNTWAKIYHGLGSEEFRSLQQVADGYILGGFIIEQDDFFVVKTDPSGDIASCSDHIINATVTVTSVTSSIVAAECTSLDDASASYTPAIPSYKINTPTLQANTICSPPSP